MYVGESSIDAVVTVREARVVKAEQVQNGRVQVVNGRHVFNGFESELIGLPVAHAAPNSSAAQPGCEALRIVVSPLCSFLKHRHAAEFCTPHDQCVFQQASLFHVIEQGSGWLVKDFCVDVILIAQIGVAVPVQATPAGIGTVEQLHKTHAIFNQSSRQDGILCECGLGFRLRNPLRTSSAFEQSPSTGP